MITAIVLLSTGVIALGLWALSAGQRIVHQDEALDAANERIDSISGRIWSIEVQLAGKAKKKGGAK